MGFRRLEAFNKALLAKQIWRIMENPGSLVARVLKARYFKHQDVMQANLGSNPSYIWRSFMWSRELLNKGITWRVGNGQQIQTFRDNWIPGIHSSLRHVTPGFETVDTLMQGQGWNTNTNKAYSLIILLKKYYPFHSLQINRLTPNSGSMIQKVNTQSKTDTNWTLDS